MPKERQLTLFGVKEKPKYIKSKYVKELETRLHREKCLSHLAIKPTYIPMPKREDKTANGLTCCILDFLKLEGWQAERINVMGRPIETANGIKWIKGQCTVGSADISATINGRSVKIEIKIGKDRQSEEQKEYQRQIEHAGGLYFIAKEFATFVEWYNNTTF